MNKIYAFSILFLAATAFVGCTNEEDDIFSQSAAERLNAASEKYTNILTSSPGGWAMEYYATNDTIGASGASDYRAVGYLLGAKFNTDGTVDMGMNNSFSGNQYLAASSLFDIITDNGPVLSFDSYNPCIHRFSDPADLPYSVKGGAGDVTGLGAEGDFEFVLTDVQEEAQLAEIKGKKRSTYIRLTRLPEGTDFNNYINECDSFRDYVFGASNFSEPVMHLGNGKDLCLNGPDKANTPKIYPYRGDSILTMYRRPFLITKRDGNYYLRFKQDFTVAGDTTVREFVFNNETQSFTGVGEGKEVYTITGQQPLAFFDYKFADGSWAVSTRSDMSDDLQSLISDFSSSLKKIRYSIANNRLSFVKSDNGYELRITVRNRRNQSSQIAFLFNGTIENDKLTLTYNEPVELNDKVAASANILKAVPSLQNLLNGFNGSYTVSYTSSPFNLHELKFTADDGKYFVASFM